MLDNLPTPPFIPPIPTLPPILYHQRPIIWANTDIVPPSLQQPSPENISKTTRIKMSLKSYPKPRLASHPSLFPIRDILVLSRFRMLDQAGSSTITELPLHIAIPALELFLVKILRPVSLQIPICILLTQPPLVPFDYLFGTSARHLASETNSEI